LYDIPSILQRILWKKRAIGRQKRSASVSGTGKIESGEQKVVVVVAPLGTPRRNITIVPRSNNISRIFWKR
jgi:hypothetical protein